MIYVLLRMKIKGIVLSRKQRTVFWAKLFCLSILSPNPLVFRASCSINIVHVMFVSINGQSPPNQEEYSEELNTSNYISLGENIYYVWYLGNFTDKNTNFGNLMT